MHLSCALLKAGAKLFKDLEIECKKKKNILFGLWIFLFFKVFSFFNFRCPCTGSERQVRDNVREVCRMRGDLYF